MTCPIGKWDQRLTRLEASLTQPEYSSIPLTKGNSLFEIIGQETCQYVLSLFFFFFLFIQGLSVCFFVLGWPCTVDRTLKSKFDQSQNTFSGLGVSGHGNTLTMAFCRRQWVKSLKLCEYDNFVCTSPPLSRCFDDVAQISRLRC